MISEGIMTTISGILNFRRSGRPGEMHPGSGSAVMVMWESISVTTGLVSGATQAHWEDLDDMFALAAEASGVHYGHTDFI